MKTKYSFGLVTLLDRYWPTVTGAAIAALAQGLESSPELGW